MKRFRRRKRGTEKHSIALPRYVNFKWTGLHWTTLDDGLKDELIPKR